MKLKTLIISFLFTAYSFCYFSAFAQPAARVSDEEMLDDIQRKGFDYFIFERDEKTGLVRDRAHNFQRGAKFSAASIAATGFALSAYPVGIERNWIDISTAREMTRQNLVFMLSQAAQDHGFFYHFLDMRSGNRAGSSELSPIDTALYLAGALFAAEYYEDAGIRDLVEKIYERVDWNWMLHGGDTLVMAWSPEQGFQKNRWDHYNESMMMYLMAIGAPKHSIPASSWHTLYRPAGSYGGYHVIQMPPLFTHQYSHIWVDFRDKNDGHADYFKNSVNATLANRAFCIKESSKYQTYGPDSWGLTASDGPFGYKAYGAPPGWAQHDGTVAPTGCGSSIVFTPKESLACLRNFYENQKEKLWGLYGFSDAFNLDRQWYGQEAVGIDQGALLLMIENYRSGLIWEKMSKSIPIQKAMEAVGFKAGTMEIAWPEVPEVTASYAGGAILIDGYLKDWPKGGTITLNTSHRESGSFKDDADLQGQIGFAWDENALYFYAKVTDDSVLVRKTGKNIWMDDLLELHIDPAGDGFYWQNRKDFQLGFRARVEDENIESWSWFQNGEDPQAAGQVKAKGYVHQGGYIIEGAIPWRYLSILPKAGEAVRISPALHDIDEDRSMGKLHWFLRNEDDLLRFTLGKVILGSKNPVSPPTPENP